MNAITADVRDVQRELLETSIELRQAGEMTGYAEPEFLDGQYLLIEGLKRKMGALIKTAKELERGV